MQARVKVEREASVSQQLVDARLGARLLVHALHDHGAIKRRSVTGRQAARHVDHLQRITIHVGVGEFGRNALIEWINATEPLRSDTTYVHCCTLNDMEWKLIKDSGGAVSIAGYVEKLMGHGNPPVQKAIDAGIRPCLSVDVETSVPGDFFNQMRSVFSQQKNEVWTRQLAREKNDPELVRRVEALSKVIENERSTDVETRLRELEEAVGIDPSAAAPDHWRHVMSRLTVGHEPRRYTRAHHEAWLLRRRLSP